MTDLFGPPRLADAGIRLDQLPQAGREMVVAPDADERGAIAAFLEITSLDRLDVRLVAKPFRGGIRVEGTLAATLVQPSVVSLEPVLQEIDEPIDRVFLPAGEKSFAGPAGAEVFVDLDGDDLPDHFEGGEADLSDLIVEVLALAIDPYPRLGGESVGDVPGDDADADVTSDSPFAALEALKNRGDENT